MKSAHVHVLSVVAAELSQLNRVGWTDPLRLLDIGCGYGQLIVDLIEEFPRFDLPFPGIEVYGYEVLDHRAGTPSYYEAALKILGAVAEDRVWRDLIRIGPASEAWPFPDDFFDLAFSNQVVEHVEDLGHFFRQQSRVLKAGGRAVHFYPSRECVLEPHSGLPLAHRVNRSMLTEWLRQWSRWGFGKYRRYRRERGATLESFCSEFHAYLGRYVFFRRNKEVRDLAALFSRETGFGYAFPMLKRAMADDWEPGSYRFEQRLASRSGVAPFACSTLVQRY